MEIVNVTLNNNIYVRTDNNAAWNPEREIALVQDGSPVYELAYRVGGQKLYNIITNYKALYMADNYADVWQYIKANNGTITSKDDNFDEVMRAEGLEDILGNVRIYRINFTTKIMSNGLNCEPCKC